MTTQEDARFVSFALDGQWYELTVSAGEARELRGRLAEWIAVARVRSGKRRRASQPLANSQDGARNKEIRDWARRNDMYVTSQGRIPDQVKRAYAESRRRPGRVPAAATRAAAASTSTQLANVTRQ